MDRDTSAIGDVLTRDILDIAFERVHVRHPGLANGVEVHREVTALTEFRFLASDFARLRGLFTLVIADEDPTVFLELLGDCPRCAVSGYF